MIRKIVFKYLTWPILKGLLGMQIHYPKSILKQGQAVFIANHNSHLDTAGLLSGLPFHIARKIRPVIGRDYFDRVPWQEKWSRWLLKAINIPRKKTDRKTGENPITMMTDALDQGDSLLLFPEGTHGKPEKMEPFKPGIGRLLTLRPDIPFIPIFIENASMVLPDGSKLPVPHQFSIRLGEAQLVQSTEVPEVVEEVQNAVMALKKAS
ncbi:1-acyl-sn-glycerol-3-phosphate acyltransferase [bacterium SCSIO 12741]|nr:1-acyl-sn-glycerol-3-phosphate acyltransferase [bacterium SCSIO 12741]